MKNFETRDEETADKELISSSNQSNWKTRCWHWGGLTSSDPIVKRRAQVICGICSIVWIAFILLLFLVTKFISSFIEIVFDPWHRLSSLRSSKV